MRFALNALGLYPTDSEIEDAIKCVLKQRQTNPCCRQRSRLRRSNVAGANWPPAAAPPQSEVDKYHMNLPQFKEVRDLLKSRGCERGLCALPYAMRGLTLRQIKAIKAGVLDSGWLQSCCDKFNKEHAEEIGKGKKTRHCCLYPIQKPVSRRVAGFCLGAGTFLLTLLAGAKFRFRRPQKRNFRKN